MIKLVRWERVWHLFCVACDIVLLPQSCIIQWIKYNQQLVIIPQQQRLYEMVSTTLIHRHFSDIKHLSKQRKNKSNIKIKQLNKKEHSVVMQYYDFRTENVPSAQLWFNIVIFSLSSHRRRCHIVVSFIQFSAESLIPIKSIRFSNNDDSLLRHDTQWNFCSAERFISTETEYIRAKSKRTDVPCHQNQ